MNLGKDIMKAYTKPVKEKDLFKILNKSAKQISKANISALKTFDKNRLDEKTQNKILNLILSLPSSYDHYCSENN